MEVAESNIELETNKVQSLWDGLETEQHKEGLLLRIYKKRGIRVNQTVTH